jgi:rhodanese-related sulfurtransferase
MAVIDVREARNRFEAGCAVLVDVREADEVAALSVPGALHIPLDQLTERLEELPCDQDILFLCRSGSRSGMACERVANLLPHAKSVDGGIKAWEKAGGAVTVRSRMIPLMRQVQIVAGLLILAGFFFKPLWFLVPVVGIGQTLAGFTGFCGMAKLLQKMPWNRSCAAALALKGGASCQG